MGRLLDMGELIGTGVRITPGCRSDTELGKVTRDCSLRDTASGMLQRENAEENCKGVTTQDLVSRGEKDWRTHFRSVCNPLNPGVSKLSDMVALVFVVL